MFDSLNIDDLSPLMLNYSHKDAGERIFRLWGSMPCLLMLWLLKSPDYQQEWYWLCRSDNMYCCFRVAMIEYFLPETWPAIRRQRHYDEYFDLASSQMMNTSVSLVPLTRAFFMTVMSSSSHSSSSYVVSCSTRMISWISFAIFVTTKSRPLLASS